jgi:hypothetical protein
MSGMLPKSGPEDISHERSPTRHHGHAYGNDLDRAVRQCIGGSGKSQPWCR